MSSIINLMYFAPEDTIYFIDVNDIDPIYLGDFVEFFTEVIDCVNLINPEPNIGLELPIGDSSASPPVTPTLSITEFEPAGNPIGFFNRDTGGGAFPFHQSMQLTNIGSSNVLTGFIDDVVYEFEIEVQDIIYRFSEVGAALSTYQDIITLFSDNSPAVLTYFSTTDSSTPLFNMRSDISAIANTNDNNGTSVLRTSDIKLNRFANIDHSDNSDFESMTSVDGSFANFNFLLPEPTASEILTLVDPDDETVFSFTIGTERNLSVRGFQARTYQDVIDTINLFDSVSAIYRVDSGEKKHIVTIFVPVPKFPQFNNLITSMDETDPDIITRVATLRSRLISYGGNANTIEIESFVGLTKNSEILHNIRNSIVGGFDMLTVIQNSKRTNGSYWTEIVPIQNNKRSANDVVSQIPEQRNLIEAIRDDETAPVDVKRRISLDLGKIISLGGTLLGGSEAIKSELINVAVGRIISLISDNYIDVDENSPITAQTEEIGTIQDNIIDDGYLPGALDDNGNVIDESLLTDAQRSQLLSPDRITVE